MTEITIRESKSPFDSLDRLAYNFAYQVFEVFKKVSRLPVLIGWVIGLVLLVTVGFLYTILFYIPLLLVRKRLKREVNTRIAVIPLLAQREAMLEHAHIEEARIGLEKAARIGREFFVFLPLVNEIRKSALTLHKLEVALFTKSYPDYKKPLTSEQTEKLFDSTLPWREDWEDKSMDVYNR